MTLSLKEAAKKGDKDVCNILAKEIVNSRKVITRLTRPDIVMGLFGKSKAGHPRGIEGTKQFTS